MTEKYFVDTNILIYRYDPRYPAHQSIAKEWLGRIWEENSGVISTQVIKEFYGTLTRKIAPREDRNLSRDIVRHLLFWEVVETDSAVFEAAWRIEKNGHCSWWDALIIAAAQHAGCTAILSEDMGPHLMPAGLTLINPFESAVHEAPARYETRGE